MVKEKLSDGKEIYIDGYLKNALDSIAYNVNNDFDFVLIITGDGMVRTGKSVLALNVCAYLAKKLRTKFDIDNVFFESDKMIEKAQAKPKNSVLLYDEARESLATAKRFSKVQQDLVDFFNECGQLNHIFVLVLPDYFSLNWEMATNRSEILLNVYRDEVGAERRLKGHKTKSEVTIFKRGYFEMFNRKKKAELYWRSKRSGLRQYNLVKPNFRGRFTDNYPIDEKLYREKKREMLSRFTERHKEVVKAKRPNLFTTFSLQAYEILDPAQKKLISQELGANIDSIRTAFSEQRQKLAAYMNGGSYER